MSEWWKSAVFYQLYPRSFQDSNGDGVGDLQGILERLDYLSWLGVDALWLSPIHPSPQIDFGYDVSDYCGIDPLFGDKDLFLKLLAEVHERGMRLVLDGVFNHCSTAHPWFQRAVQGEKQGWFHFRERPNNWASAFGGSAWSWNEEAEKYYLHTFLSEQADLNWSNPEVEEAVLEVLRYWLELGVDGFRLDVFNCYHKEKGYRDNPSRWSPLALLSRLVYPYLSQHHLYDRDRPELRASLQRMSSVVEAYDGVLLGETLDEQFRYENAAPYTRDGQLQLAFNFRLLHSKYNAPAFHQAISSWVNALGPEGWPTWVLSNHDFPRHATRWSVSSPELQLRRMKQLALLTLTLRGTPCLYYGEELGLEERKIRRSELKDPVGLRYWPFFQGRDGARTPMCWSEAGGFSEVEPWLPYGEGVAPVAAQREDEDSLLCWYQLVLTIRKENLALQLGAMKLEPEDPQLLIFERHYQGSTLRVVLNLSRHFVSVPAEGKPLCSSGYSAGQLGPYGAFLLQL